MNVRPTRVPSPPQETVHAEPHEEATFTEVERPNNVPSVHKGNTAPPQPIEREPVALPVTGFSNLAAGIAGVMADIKPVAKSGWNDFHKYNYARMQDLSTELTPLMGKHGIVVFQNEMDRDMFDEGRAMAVRYQFTIVHKSGEIWPERPVITGVSMCRTSNGKYDDKAFNKCHTSARKYFLLSLFQIPTDDDEDADGGPAEPRQRPQGRRPVPSPSGKTPPHLIPINEGEAPQDWTKRFGEVITKATTAAEIDLWYSENAVQFGKLKRFDDIYNAAIDHMDACAAKLAAPKKDDPITSGPTDTHTSSGTPRTGTRFDGFPGDTPLKAAAAEEGIPWGLDRQLTQNDRDLLMVLKEAFEQCTDADQIGAEWESIAMPAKDSVSLYVWDKLADLMDQHILRVNANA